jgi:hypothetical protein
MPFLLNLTTQTQAFKMQLGTKEKDCSAILRELSKTKKRIATLAEREGPMAAHRTVIQGLVGVGFNNDRTLRAHASEWVEKIEEAYMGDTRKQYQLATAIAQRLQDDKETSLASSAIVEALKEFIHTLQSTYTGHFPTQVEAVYDAVSLGARSGRTRVRRRAWFAGRPGEGTHIRRVR